MRDWPTGLMVIQGNHLESLKNVLVEWVKRYPLAPLETDTVLVQSNGIAQWLQQALAEDRAKGGCDIAASINVNLPGRFVWQAYRSVFWELDTQSPFDLKPMTWRLFKVLGRLNQHTNHELFQPLFHFMESGSSGTQRRYVLAERIAKLFDQYQVYRADWLQAWEAGSDQLPQLDSTKENPVPGEQLWQPALWRLLVADVEQDGDFDSGKRQIVNRAEIHQDFLKYCQAHSEIEGLPRRVVVFGLSSLPNQTLEVLRAIAPFTQVLLFSLNPSAYYWGDLIEGRQLLRQSLSRQPLTQKRADKKMLSLEEAHLYGNPLLASWGKLGRDYLHSLEEKDTPDDYRKFFIDSKIDLFEPPAEDTLLSQLQADIYHLRSVDDAKQLGRTVSVGQDASIQFIETHSRQREIEVLHDRLLAEFEQAAAQGKALQPRDVLIMAPDINAYVPHIEAVFGRYSNFRVNGKYQDKRFLPFHIADQSARQQHPVVGAFEALLSLSLSRFEATDLLSFIDVEAIRRRFGLDEGDVSTLKNWIESANIRWGLHQDQRQSLGLVASHEQNTWLFGLKRMLLGYAVGAEDMWRGVLPFAEIGGLEAEVLGKLHRLIDSITNHWQRVRDDHTLEDWGHILENLLEDFFNADSDIENRVLSRIQSQITHLVEQTQGSGAKEEKVSVDVIQEALMGQLDEPSLSQRFLAGSINFATLMPMRAIPFQQVYLIGMNDGDYPQVSTPMDFDLMVGDYRPGDRSRREDARYLFLEALLSAREKLVISWQGRSAKDNSELPPSVLVGQLRDYLSKAWPQDGLLSSLTQAYPMQSFSRRYFEQDSPHFTYQAEWQTAYSGETSKPEDKVICLPSWCPDAPLTAKKLARFLRGPVDALYAERLDISKPSDIEETKVVENFESNGLEIWHVHDQMLQHGKKHYLTETEWDTQVDAELRRMIAAGELQSGAFADIRKEKLYPIQVKQAYFCWRNVLASSKVIPDTLRQVSFSMQFDNRKLTIEDDLERLYDVEQEDQKGSVTRYKMQFILQASKLYADSTVESDLVARKLVSNGKPTKVKWRNVAEGWIKHLIANQAHGGGVTTQLISPTGDVRLHAMSAEAATKALKDILHVWLDGMHAPVCFAVSAGIAQLTGYEDRVETRFFEELENGHYGQLHFEALLTTYQMNQLEGLGVSLCTPWLKAFTEEQ